MNLTIIREEELRQCIELDMEVVDAIKESFRRLALGDAMVPPVLSVELPERRGELDVKTAVLRGLDSFAVKIASGFFDNEKDDLPVASGMMILVSSVTGFPKAILVDNGYLTQVRTGAAGALAADNLARTDIKTIGIIGAGLQGRYQARALQLVRDFQRLLIFDILEEKVKRYAEEMRADLGVDIEVMEDVETLVRDSDIVVTTTPSRKAYLRADWLHPGLHITAMGADMEEKQELFPEVFGQADVIACDLKSQCFVRGELHHSLKEGIISQATPIVELGDMISGKSVGRRSNDQITICDLTGVGIQDTAIARLAFEKARVAGLGMDIDV